MTAYPIPRPSEITAVIADAEQACRNYGGGIGICGAEPPGHMAGFPIVCTLTLGHTSKIKHRDRSTGFAWWGSEAPQATQG